MRHGNRNAVVVSFLLAVFSTLLCACVATAQTTLSKKDYALSVLENEIVGELNQARARPDLYANYLEELKPHFSGNQYRPPGREALVTQEGWGVVQEAISFLRSQKPMPSFSVSTGMCMGATALVKDHATTGNTGHKGADGSFCEDRLNRFGSWSGTVGENISYGADTARERVLAFIIDDGVANRGHRRRLFNPDYKVAGVACGGHAKLGSMCVITFAGGYTEKPLAADTKNNRAPSVKLSVTKPGTTKTNTMKLPKQF